jgi:type I restriction enzyme M protein
MDQTFHEPVAGAGLAGIDAGRLYTAAEIKELKADNAVDAGAPPVIRRVHKRGTEPDPLHGLFQVTLHGKPCVVEYEPDSDLRDTEQIPLTEPGGVDAFIKREVLPYAPDAWYDPSPKAVKIGYEINFAKYFYKPQPLRTLDEIRVEIVALEHEAEGLLSEIMGETGR